MARALAADRIALLERQLADRGSVSVADLARRLKVSEMTVRRDLDKLAGRGGVARVHGGAVADGRLRFGSRLEQASRAKAAAARKLLALLPETGSIYLDGSTTIYRLAELLAGRTGLLVATNNLDTFLRLTAAPGLRPVLIGGALNRDTDNFVGPFARRCLDGLSFDVACCSAYALDPELGPSEPAPEDAEIKEHVCRRAQRVCLAVDHAKLGRRASGVWPLPEGATLATDLSPTDPALRPFRARFATIL